MNSLEFIDREISSTEIDLWYSKRLLIENPPSEELKKEMLEIKINVLERNMKCLQQIKSELEAWYVVKKRRSYAYIKHKNLFDLSVTLSTNDPDCERLLKALEVEENDNR